VHTSFTHQALPLKVECDSSEEIVLMDEHMSALKLWLSKFRAANPGNRVKIINDAASSIERNSAEGIQPDKDAMIDVCDLSAN